MEHELYHHGILGMKWGVRRFQNADGSLTSAGRKRYGVTDVRSDGYSISKNKDNRIKKQAAKEHQKKEIKELGRKMWMHDKSWTYNEATYRKAAKYVVKNGLDKESAIDLAKKKARRNTTLTVAAVGAAFIADYYRVKRRYGL